MFVVLMFDERWMNNKKSTKPTITLQDRRKESRSRTKYLKVLKVLSKRCKKLTK